MGILVGVAVASGLHTRWVRQLGHSVEVGPEEDEAGAHEEEDQSDPETDVVKGLPMRTQSDTSWGRGGHRLSP